MSLRAKPPILEPNRFRALIYGNAGVGKTHFVTSMPNVYYIDTEGASKYKIFVDKLKENNSVIAVIYDLQEIINEIKELLSTKHDFKTLVIDSISVPCGHLSNLEVERLTKKTPSSEGTEFGANVAKAKRLTFHLGILLSRLDMNVIVTSHEKTKYEKNIEIGKDADVSEKLGYCLGSVFNLRMQGGSRKAFVQKTRYTEFKPLEVMDFENGFEILRSRLGDDIFYRESKIENLATKEQLSEIKRLIELLNFPDEKVQKWLSASQSNSLDEMNSEKLQKCIDQLKSQVAGE